MRLEPPHSGFVADLHIHSYLSRATSKLCDLPHLAMWAQRKGIRLLGTGDFTHPEWFARISEQLEPRDNGLFQLKPDLREEVRAQVPAACQGDVDFVLQVEISSIYKRGGRVRKVHNLVYMPDLEAARRLCEALGRIGNIQSDGRPILGLDSRDLLEIVLGCSDRAYLIPAHIWTPWFSVFGSKSGFDDLEECYGDLTDHIFALETGLSSDPPMNWRLSQLDGLTLVSNSDAHSPSKLGREANLFRTEVTYDAVFEALHSGDPARFAGTLEFYPEEGKYHLDGCRRCGVRLLPDQTREHGGRCPECGKLVTVGVLSRVEDLADRPPGARPDTAMAFEIQVSQPEVLAACFDQGPATKRVQRECDRLMADLGPELTILRSLPVDELERKGSLLLAEAIRRVRAGELSIHPGYDGAFGVIRIFDADERERISGQSELFPVPKPVGPDRAPAEPEVVGSPDVTAAGEPEGQQDLFEARSAARTVAAADDKRGEEDSVIEPLLRGLTHEQRAAVEHESTPLLIVAGPGAGKTRTLTRRIAHRVRGGVSPERVLAVTFTHRAAGELRERFAGLLDPDAAAAMTVTTFHGLGLDLLRAHGSEVGLSEGFAVLDERGATEVLALELGEPPSGALRKRVRAIGNAKLLPPGVEMDEALRGDVEVYGRGLARQSAVDYSDLLLLAVSLLRERPSRAAQVQRRWSCFAVDEYQDIDPWQRELLRLIVGESTDLCAIGDPDQSIYGFRGADVALFAAFAEDYRAVHRASLGVSFRSTPAIIDLAQEVVRHAPDFGRVAMSAARGAGDRGRPELQLFASPEAEAVEVAHRIEELVGGVRSLTDASDRRLEGGLGFGDIAVLARTGARLDAVAKGLARLGVPTQRAGIVEADAQDEVALAALLALYAGRSTPADLLGLLAREGVTGGRLDGLLPTLVDSTLEASLRAGASVAGARPKARRALARLSGFLKRLRAGGGSGVGDKSEMLRWVLAEAAACLELHWPPDPDAPSMTRVWAEAGRLTQGPKMPTVDALLDLRALRATEDSFEGRAERVALLTLHAAKGLEFRAVFIVGCEDGTIPWIRPGTKEPESPHEERRLLYVGMTRAMDRLWMGAAHRLRRHGQTHQAPPSRFLAGVSPQLLQVTEHQLPRRIQQRQLDLDQ